MTFTVSASLARIVAKEALALDPDPSATTWSRLEPLPTSDDVADSLRARVADPLWLLARQWQFNEFRGEDAGSPVRAALSLLGLPVASLLPMQGDAAPRALDDASPPIEALVEHEQVLPAHPKLNAQAGQQLMRQWRAAGLGDALPALLAAFPAALPAPDDAVADNLGFVWHALLDARAPDALRLAAALRPLAGDAAAQAAFAAPLGIGADRLPAFAAVVERWLRWLDALALDGSAPGASAYWNPHRLEYAFALGAGDPQSGARLEAVEYTDGRVDWHSFDVAPAEPGGAPAFAPPALRRHAWPRLLPALAHYPGMPADRYWEFEDGRVNFGMATSAKSELARVALLEYALVFGNDWYVLPLTLPVNALYKVEPGGFVVADNFGGQVAIPPARNLDGTQWTMYELSVAANAPRARLDDILYLCPAAETLEGPPLEHVILMRDEMANLVWGIERRVQGASGEPLDRRFESTRLSTTQSLRAPAGAAPAPGAPLAYRLQTPVAAHWIPFLPVKKQGATPLAWSIQLQRGVVVHGYQVDPARLADPRNLAYADFIERLRRQVGFVEHGPVEGPAENPLQRFAFHPRGSLLRLDPNAPVAADYLRLEEEEVPRDGVELKRCFNYARDAQGHARLWIGRSKTTGRGEGASGLRFDVVARGGA